MGDMEFMLGILVVLYFFGAIINTIMSLFDTEESLVDYISDDYTFTLPGRILLAIIFLPIVILDLSAKCIKFIFVGYFW